MNELGEGEDEVQGDDVTVFHRASDIFEASRERKLQAGAPAMAKKKPARIWSDPEYRMIKKGPILMEDPDMYPQDLQLSTLTIFIHVDPTVEFCADRTRPKWKGVFRMHPNLGYGESGYYNPKQEHLQRVYAERVKKDQPADNIIRLRDGTELPYWVDDWHHVKESETKHKKVSKEKQLAANNSLRQPTAMTSAVAKKNSSVASGTAGLPIAKSIVPIDNKYIFPLEGWMQTHTVSKGASLATVMRATLLKQNPAKELAAMMPNFMKDLGASEEIRDENALSPDQLRNALAVGEEVPKKIPKAVTFENNATINNKKRERPASEEDEAKVQEEIPIQAMVRVPGQPGNGGRERLQNETVHTSNAVHATANQHTSAIANQHTSDVRFDVTIKSKKSKYIATQYSFLESGEHTQLFNGMDAEEVLNDFVKFACK